MSDQILKEIHDEIPCRASQINQLFSLFGQKNDMTVPSIFLYGQTASGKTTVVKKLLQVLDVPHAFLNCVEFYSARTLLEEVLCQVADVEPNSENGFAPFEKCDNMNDFIHGLRRAIKQRGAATETVYIVLDKAERIRDMDSNLLPAFVRLQELVNTSVCVIFISGIVWEKFRCGTGTPDPFIIHFPDYGRDEMVEILSRDRPDDVTSSLYASYLGLLFSVLYMVCRDLHELRHLARQSFPVYLEPVKKGEAAETDVKKLWRNIEPHLKKVLNTVYLREMPSVLREKHSTDTTNELDIMEVHNPRIHLELPYFSKYLLIAAYIASYNPAKSDKRFFLKRDEKMRKSSVVAKHKRERTNNQLLGPKAFPLDRMMAIFYSIVEGKVHPSFCIYTQISSLVSLNLLSHVGHADQLDTPKYKCLASLDTIRHVARMVDFEIMRYLYDFA